MGALVEVKDMCKIYNPGENEVRALDHVNVSIDENEFVAIIGHSGSGKSTLMNMLGCLDIPTSGSYFLHGQDVSSLSDDELSDIRNREIGFIFQGFNLIPNLTAEENVRASSDIPRHRQKGAPGAGSEGALQGGAGAPHGSQAVADVRRTAAARCHCEGDRAGAPVILADEPTGNLDSGSTKEIMGILKQLHEEGRTVILITHDNDIAAQARRVIRIKDGKVEADFEQDVD